MLEKFFASIGVGSATVDLEIPYPQAELGGVLEGVVGIKGGTVEQEAKKVFLHLVCQSSYPEGGQTRPYCQRITTAAPADGILIRPGQEETVPVRFEIPSNRNLPISRGRTRYYLQTELDIKLAVDLVDHDEIVIVPNKYLQTLFDAMEMLGFKEKEGSGDYNGRYQQFDYIPASLFTEVLDEVRLHPIVHEKEMLVALVMDKKGEGFLGFIHDIHMDERVVKFRIPLEQMESVSQVADMLKGIMETEHKKI